MLAHMAFDAAKTQLLLSLPITSDLSHSKKLKSDIQECRKRLEGLKSSGKKELYGELALSWYLFTACHTWLHIRQAFL